MEIISHGSNTQQQNIRTTCPYCGCCFRFNLQFEATYMRWAPSDNAYSKDKAAYILGYKYTIHCPDCHDHFYISDSGRAMSSYSEQVLNARDSAIEQYNEELELRHRIEYDDDD